MAFGNSGHGTIHSYLKSEKYSDYFDLDMVVYVFVENDLGDQMEVIKNATSLPYVELKDNIIEINDHLLSNHINNRTFTEKIKKYIFYNKFILLQTIYRRLKMLQQYGVNISANESDFMMSGKGNINKPPNQNDLPSTWNNNYRKRAILLGESVILMWSKEVIKSRNFFVVLYVPRQSEWRKNDIDQDSWKYWLNFFCYNNRLYFIDPSKHFLNMILKEKKYMVTILLKMAM